MVSNYFSQSQLKGILKTGDVILPGTEKSPSFSATGCIHHIDRMAKYMAEDDLAGLQLVFSLLRWMPRWAIVLLMKVCNHSSAFPSFIGAGLRMLEIGLKGVTLSPYYANLTALGYGGQKVYDVIGWHPKFIVTEDALPIKNVPVNRENPEPQDVEAVYQRAKKAGTEIRDWG
jgi:hypothetical protein